MAEQRRALESKPEIRRFLLENVRPTGRELGVGSYGSVEEVEVNGLMCAGKKIHKVLLSHDELQTIARKYEVECQLISELRHPNVVQFLGLCFLEDSSLPVLVMEKLVTSLHSILENTPNIPLSLKVSMLRDAARGLLYLHSHKPNPIVHRDLSAKNVLLNDAMVAKVSDLGNSRIVDLQPGQQAQTLTRVPGTAVYMPPEALESNCYGPSLDIFSFGHLTLFTLIQIFPGDLLPPNYRDPQNRKHLIGRSEVERREKYIARLHQQLGEKHALVQLIKDCLDDAEDRPSAEKLLQQLEKVKLEDPYQHLTKLDMIQLLQKQTDPQTHKETQRLQTQLQQVQLELAESRAEKNSAVQEKDEIIKQKDEVIKRLQEEIQQKDDLRQRLPTPQGETMALPKGAHLRKGTKVHFRQLKPLPMAVHHAQAVIYKGALYVGVGYTPSLSDAFIICVYRHYNDTWDSIQTPTRCYALAVYKGNLVLAGGCFPGGGVTSTNQLWLADDQQHNFKQTMEPMNIPTNGATAFTMEGCLAIAGGYDGHKHLDTVQVYNGKQWCLAQSLPIPCCNIKHVCHDDVCYLVGGLNQGQKLFYTFLPWLLQSVQPANTVQRCGPTSWNKLTNAPLERCSIAVLRSELVAIGGVTNSLPSSCLYIYSQQTQTWEMMESTLPQALRSVCSITLPSGELVIIGGRGSDGHSANVYKATIMD